MPNWKKVIVSGSDAILNEVTASSGLDTTDVTIDDWGSISASLASIESTGTTQDLQDITDNGNTTTNVITASKFLGDKFNIGDNNSSESTNFGYGSADNYGGTDVAGPTVFGYNALLNAQTFDAGVAIGHSAGKFLSATLSQLHSNTFVGGYAARNGEEARSTTAIGTSALQNFSGSYSSIAIGHNALVGAGGGDTGNSTITNTIAIGVSAGFHQGSPSNTIMIGNSAGNINNYPGSGLNTDGSDNSIYIGHEAVSKNKNRTNEIVIGYQATGSGNNSVTIGNSNTLNNYFFGNVSGSDVTIDDWGSVSSSLSSISATLGPGTISGRALGSNLENLNADGVTLDFNITGSSYNGSTELTLSVITGSIASGSTALATGDQIVSYVSSITTGLDLQDVTDNGSITNNDITMHLDSANNRHTASINFTTDSDTTGSFSLVHRGRSISDGGAFIIEHTPSTDGGDVQFPLQIDDNSTSLSHEDLVNLSTKSGSLILETNGNDTKIRLSQVSMITSSNDIGYDGFDISIKHWGSVSASLASLEASSNPTLQDVTDNGSTTTNNITIDSTSNARLVLDRASNSDDAEIEFKTDGTTNWSIGTGQVGGDAEFTIKGGSSNFVRINSNGQADFLSSVTASAVLADNLTINQDIVANNFSGSFLRLDENGNGFRMTNIGAFDNSSGDFRIFANQDLILSTNGQNGTAVTFDQTTKNADFQGDISGSDVTIDDWGSISASLASIESTGSSQTLQQVTDNGNTTTNDITISGSITISGDNEALILTGGSGSIETDHTTTFSAKKTISNNNIVTIFSVSQETYVGGVVEYTFFDSNRDNMRSGIVTMVANDTATRHSELVTTDIGNTDNLEIQVVLTDSGFGMRVNNNTGSSFTAVCNVKVLKE